MESSSRSASCVSGTESRFEADMVHCYSDEKEAIWDGLGDNRKNGLRNSSGDLKKMILIALEKYADKSHRLIAEHIGCSATYVDRIAKEQVQTSLHQTPATCTGRDGKVYPAKKSEKPKKAEPTIDTEEKPEKEMEEANVLFATSSGSQEDATTVSDIYFSPSIN